MELRRLGNNGTEATKSDGTILPYRHEEVCL